MCRFEIPSLASLTREFISFLPGYNSKGGRSVCHFGNRVTELPLSRTHPPFRYPLLGVSHTSVAPYPTISLSLFPYLSLYLFISPDLYICLHGLSHISRHATWKLTRLWQRSPSYAFLVSCVYASRQILSAAVKGLAGRKGNCTFHRSHLFCVRISRERVFTWNKNLKKHVNTILYKQHLCTDCLYFQKERIKGCNEIHKDNEQIIGKNMKYRQHYNFTFWLFE